MGNKKKNSRANNRKSNQNLIWISIGIAILVLAAIIVFRPANTAMASEISVADASAKRDSGAFILDVREPSEWNESHIPGAVLIPLGELASRTTEIPKDQEVVVVCRSGNRSAQGRDILLSAGFTQVTSMAGGINQWKAAGLETVSGP